MKAKVKEIEFGETSFFLDINFKIGNIIFYFQFNRDSLGVMNIWVSDPNPPPPHTHTHTHTHTYKHNNAQ